MMVESVRGGRFLSYRTKPGRRAGGVVGHRVYCRQCARTADSPTCLKKGTPAQKTNWYPSKKNFSQVVL